MSTAFGSIPDLRACGPTGGAGAIVAFELVRSPADMLTLFGAEPCTSQLAAAQRTGLWLDMLAFIPAYSAFLALGIWALRDAKGRLAVAALAAVLAGGLLDEIEGLVMFGLLDGFPGSPDQFTALFWTVRPKFALLGLGALLAAVLLLRGTMIARIAAVPVAGGALLSLWFLFADPRNPLMMAGHRYAWTALLVVAAVGAVRARWVKSKI